MEAASACLDAWSQEDAELESGECATDISCTSLGSSAAWSSATDLCCTELCFDDDVCAPERPEQYDGVCDATDAHSTRFTTDQELCELIRVELQTQDEEHHHGDRSSCSTSSSAPSSHHCAGIAPSPSCGHSHTPCAASRGGGTPGPSGTGVGGVGACWPARCTADRSLLVGWMLQLCRAAGLQRETFAGAASLLDRYVSACCAPGGQGYPPERVLQLICMACLSAAMKFEEVAPLPAADLLRLAVDPASGTPLYTAHDLGRMEWLLLQAVGWRLRAPSAFTFLQLMLPCCGITSLAASLLAASSPSSSPATAASATASATAPATAPGGAAVAVTAFQGAVVGWASCLVDLATLHAPTLPFRPSTVALACLALAERAAAAEAGDCRRDLHHHLRHQDAAAVGCVLHVSGRALEQLAPQLDGCVAALEALWAQQERQQQQAGAAVAATAAAVYKAAAAAALRQEEQQQQLWQQQQRWQQQQAQAAAAAAAAAVALEEAAEALRRREREEQQQQSYCFQQLYQAWAQEQQQVQPDFIQECKQVMGHANW